MTLLNFSNISQASALQSFFSSLKSNQFGIIFFVIIISIAFFIGFMAGKVKLHLILKKERKDAVKRSRSVINGQMVEQLAPFLPDFPCNPADVRFVGKPVDFVAFPGAGKNEPINEILFIEVKSGNSTLSEREKEIKSAVQKGHVRYVEYRIS